MRLERYRATLYSQAENLLVDRRTDEAITAILSFEEASFQIGLDLGIHTGLELADGLLRTDAKGVHAFVAPPWEFDLDRYTQHRSVDVKLYVNEYPEEDTYLATGAPALDGGGYWGFRGTEDVYEPTAYRGKESDWLFDEVATLEESHGYVLEKVSTEMTGRISQDRARALSDSRQLEAALKMTRERSSGGVI